MEISRALSHISLPGKQLDTKSGSLSALERLQAGQADRLPISQDYEVRAFIIRQDSLKLASNETSTNYNFLTGKIPLEVS